MKNSSILSYILHPFKTQKYTYRTNLSVEKLRAEINFAINQEEILDFLYNLTGTLKADNTFKLSRRMGIGYKMGPPVTIRGKLIVIEENQTNVEISIEPGLSFMLFPVLFGLIGLYSAVRAIIIHDTEGLVGTLFLIAAPILWVVLKHSKDYYKSEFEKALDLVNSKNIIEILEH